MKFYCKSCENEFKTGLESQGDGGSRRLCPICKETMETVPDYETPAHYKQRAGKPYPDNGRVWVRLRVKDKNIDGWCWKLYHWGRTRKLRGGKIIVCADPPAPPPDGWRPE